MHLTGRLAADPRHRRPAGRQAVTTIRLGVPRRASEGEQPIYVDVVSYGSLADVVADQLRRGHLVAITGRLEHRDEAAEDEPRSPHFVVAGQVDFLDVSGGRSR